MIIVTKLDARLAEPKGLIYLRPIFRPTKLAIQIDYV